MRTRLALVAGLVALAAAQGAGAHGGGGAAFGYSSTITGLHPPASGIRLTVLDGDDRLRLVNDSAQEVVVLGYEGEPYLRITPTGTFRNTRSPATYLNEDRYAEARLPDEADAEAPPVWEWIDDDAQAEWHDHRIHWMSTSPPPAVREDPRSPHRIFQWTVPLEVDGTPVAVTGTLDYTPPDEGAFSLIMLVPLAVLLLVGGAAWWLRARNERRRDAPPGTARGSGAARDRVR